MKEFLDLNLRWIFRTVLAATMFAGQLAWAAPQDLTTKGQSQSTLEQTLRVQLPFSQVTKLSAKSMLFETGNDNLVYDPGFERDLSSQGANGWTTDGNLNCVNNNSLTGFIDLYGTRWLEFSLAASTAGYCNSPSVTVPPGLAGQPGELKFRTKGGTSNSRTITITVYDGAGNILKVGDTYLHGLNSTVYVPFIFPLAATSTTVYYRVAASSAPLVMQMAIDDVYLGKASGEYNGSVYVPWTNYIPTFTTGGGTMTNYTLSAEWMRDGENAWYRGSITFTGSPGTWSTPIISVPSGQTLDGTSGLTVYPGYVSLQDVGNTTFGARMYLTSNRLGILGMTGTNDSVATISQAAPFTWVSGDSMRWTVGPIKINEWIGSGQNVMSLNTLPNITNWAAFTPTIGATTTPPTLGTNTQLFTWRKVGDSLQMKGSLTQSGAGTAGSGTYLIPLPSASGCVIDTNKQSVIASGIPNLVGTASGFNGTVIFSGYTSAYTTTQLSLNLGNDTNAVSTWGSTYLALSGASIRVSFDATVPCVGWSASVVDMPLVRNSKSSLWAGYTRDLTARILSTGVVDSESGDWINGNCAVSDTSLYTCTLVTGVFTGTVKCSGIGITTSQGAIISMDDFANTTTVKFRAAVGTVKTAMAMYVTCSADQ